MESTPPPLTAMDRAWLPSAAVEGSTLAELIGFVERAMGAQTWAILQFHGIGGGHRMDCNLSVFRDFIAWLAEHHAEQTVTVLTGAREVWSLARSVSATETHV
jgi:hypothetical protein